MNGLSWSLGNSFSKYLSAFQIIPGDKILSLTRGTKSDWELKRLREAGTRHAKCLTELLPPHLKKGLTELEIAHRISDLFFQEGHYGILRMENYGEEVYLGHIAIGDSGNYPSVFNGPVGLRGAHPATPHMGSSEISWKEGLPLTIDNGFSFEGYQTDKTQVYWLGKRSSIPSPVLAAHDFCIELQNRISEQLKPGVLPGDLWRQSSALAGKQGWAAGFMGLGANKVQFVGHGIGLAIDEYPVLAEGFDLPLESGMVLAIEPKMGIPDMGIVGVENTFEVTPDGGKCLTGENYEIICILPA
jgi:Xaa-Pro aminopeptidase